MWKRLKARIRHSGDALNRRVSVERYLWDAANGKRDLPDAAKCRELAAALGVPWDRAMKPHQRRTK